MACLAERLSIPVAGIGDARTAALLARRMAMNLEDTILNEGKL